MNSVSDFDKWKLWMIFGKFVNVLKLFATWIKWYLLPGLIFRKFDICGELPISRILFITFAYFQPLITVHLNSSFVYPELLLEPWIYLVDFIVGKSNSVWQSESRKFSIFLLAQTWWIDSSGYGKVIQICHEKGKIKIRRKEAQLSRIFCHMIQFCNHKQKG